jgi:tricarboxylate carrier
MSASDYDLTTFSGRYFFFMAMTDPRNLLISDDEINAAKKVLKQEPKAKEEDWKKADAVVSSAVHPVTDDIIPRAFRVSAIMPVNIPLIAAMLATPPSNVPMTLFLHFANQSYNSACNYSHRSGREVDWDSLGKSYGLAVTSACGIAWGLGKAASKAGPRMAKFSVLIPMFATCAANIANMAFTRSGELIDGAMLSDADGNEVGKSVSAGYDGIAKTALGRGCLVPISCLLMPPVLVAGLDKMRLLPKRGVGNIAANCACVGVALSCMLPAALAVFPQKSTFAVSSLEPKFQDLRDKRGRRITELYANKGL